MSRTYRRKNLKPSWINYEDKQEFERLSQLSTIGVEKPIIPPSPKRPTSVWWSMLDHPANEKWREEYNKWYREHLCSNAYHDYQDVKSFNRYSLGKKRYKDYVKAHNARFHSDCGFGPSWGATIPSAFVNTFQTRPLRRAHKTAIQRGLRDYNEDNIVLVEKYCLKWLYF